MESDKEASDGEEEDDIGDSVRKTVFKEAFLFEIVTNRDLNHK